MHRRVIDCLHVAVWLEVRAKETAEWLEGLEGSKEWWMSEEWWVSEEW